jgi:hypothetical protein
MKKGIGGPLDVIHSIIVMLIAIFLLLHGWGGHNLDPIFMIILAVGLFVLEIVALVA